MSTGELAGRCHPLLAYGPPGLLLAHEAQHQHAGLVVLGSRRKGRLEAPLVELPLLLAAAVLAVALFQRRRIPSSLATCWSAPSSGRTAPR